MKTILIAMFVLLLRLSSSSVALAQDTTPAGDQVIDETIIHDQPYQSQPGFFLRVTTTAKGVRIYYQDSSGNWQLSRWAQESYDFPPKGQEIKDARHKSGDQYKNELLIMLNDGSVYAMVLPGGRLISKGKLDPNAGLPRKIGGDAIYAITSNGVYVNRDSTTNIWTIDTTGLGSVFLNDIALDTLLNAFLATPNGLFEQAPDSTGWSLVSGLIGGVNTVFVDRMDRIYASTYSGVYYSTDDGESWHSNNSGLTSYIATKFGEDIFENIYTIDGAGVFRSDSGTSAWARIDTPITKMILDPINSYSPPFNDINGDSVLYLATNYGCFMSTDRGTSWTESNQGISAENLYGFANSSDRNFVSTNLGLYYEKKNDTVWTKVFPQNGYETGTAIYADMNGNLYTQGPLLNNSVYGSLPTNWKSTDDGTTWFPDTAGLTAIGTGQIPKYFADANGVQHYMFSGSAAECYAKSSGSPWLPDTAGWGILPQNYANVFGVDGEGNLFAAITNTITYTGLLLRRPLSGGTWVLDTAGLNGAIIYSITPDNAGNLYAGTWGSGIYKKTGSKWSSISLPGGLGGNSAFVTAEDNSGALFAGFATQGSNFNYVWHGVYFTTDGGSSWTSVGLDSIAVIALVPSGDSIYAVTYYDGLYTLTRTGALSVRQMSNTPASFALFQNYPNPFNPSTAISYQLSAVSRVTLKIYDVLGREVAKLVDGLQTSGIHSVTFDASRYASGVYFYKLEATRNDGKKFISTRKLVLIK